MTKSTKHKTVTYFVTTKSQWWQNQYKILDQLYQGNQENGHHNINVL